MALLQFKMQEISQPIGGAFMEDATLGDEVAERLLFPGVLVGILGDTDQDGEARTAEPRACFTVAMIESLGVLQRKETQQGRLAAPRIAQDEETSVSAGCHR